VTRLGTFARHPSLAALILAATLLLRVLVPAGFMPVFEQGRVSLALCSGYGPVVAKPMHHGGHHMPAQQTQSPCAFADLALPVLGGVDPLILAEALAFVAILALLLAVVATPRTPARLRPPLRAPPALA
jgi:hypothetical protein